MPKHLVAHGTEGRQSGAIRGGDDSVRTRPERLQPPKRTIHAPHVASCNSSSSLCAHVAYEVVLGSYGCSPQLGAGAAEQIMGKAGSLGSLAGPLA
eukprot:3804735-Alexandrium_andersonii.AAC.1